MTPGDIVLTPSGRLARYEGGVWGIGAKFVYVNEQGIPINDPDNRRRKDVFFLRSITVLRNIQPEYSRV